MSDDVKCANCINIAGLRAIQICGYVCTVKGAHSGLIESIYDSHPCDEYMFYD